MTDFCKVLINLVCQYVIYSLLAFSCMFSKFSIWQQPPFTNPQPNPQPHPPPHNSLKLSPSLVWYIVCRNCSACCPSPKPGPSAPPTGCAGCSGNPVSQAAPWNITGSCCCPGNWCAPIKTWFCCCCCSVGGWKPVVPSVEKLGENGKVFAEKEAQVTICFLLLLLQQRRGDEVMTIPASGPILSPLRHSWRISWLAEQSADRYQYVWIKSNSYFSNSFKAPFLPGNRISCSR